MRILVDENLYAPVAKMLEALGHDILDLKKDGLRGLTNGEVYNICQRENRILLTMDRDFGNILLYPPESTPGVIVVSLGRLSVNRALDLLSSFFAQYTEEQIRGRIIILEPARVRVRSSR